MDLLFCGTGWLSHTSLHLITFYYLGYFEGCFPDFVLTEAKIAKQSCGFGEVTLKLTHPHIGRGGQGHVSRGGRVSVFMSLSLCECLCVYVSVFMGADVCFCAFTVCTHPYIGRGGQGHIARGERDVGGEGRQRAASPCDNVLSPSYFVIFFSVVIFINFSNFLTLSLITFFFIPTFEKGCALNGIRIRLVGAI